MKKIFTFLFLISLSSCSSHKPEQVVQTVTVKDLAGEQMIPKQLLLQLDAELQEEFKSSPPLYSFIPLKVQFIDLQQGVLTGPKVQYTFPKGGGQIDLKDVVVSDGSFFMNFPKEQFDSNHELLHIFYVSNSPKVKIENQVFGLGCGKWNDLKSNFKKIQSEDYLKVNTTDLRYLRVLAGTYIFVFKQGRNIYLSQVTITHSQFAKELCTGSISNES